MPLHVSSILVFIIRRPKLSSLNLYTGRPPTQCDGIKYCIIKCLPPDDEHMVLETCRDIYLLTPRCRVLLEQLNGLQLVKKFPTFHGTPKFITALTSVRHLSLSWVSPIQSIYQRPTFWRSILMLSTIYS